jgi:RNA polymerase sigma-70 factor (ECF subfamily)
MGPKALAAMAEHSSRDDPTPRVVSPANAREAHGPGGDGTQVMAAEQASLDFGLVYQEHFNFVWRSSRLLGVAPEALEDAVQDVFSVVSRQLGGFEGRSSLRTWLFAIVQRVAANHRRMRRRKLQQLEPLDDSLLDPGPTPHARAEAAEVLGVIEAFCERLDEEWRALFVLSLVENIPAREVSRALGIHLNTVYSRVYSLRAGLGRALAAREGERGRR